MAWATEVSDQLLEVEGVKGGEVKGVKVGVEEVMQLVVEVEDGKSVTGKEVKIGELEEGK